MEEAIPAQRANRDFRVKFPDDVLQESLAGQLWFGAECLAAGSSILNREVESASMRPLARALTKNLDRLRCVLRDQCLRNITDYTERIQEALIIFDKLFAEFELSYVSAMVPVKTMKEYDMMQEVTILFSETVQRALRVDLLTQDMIDDYDPALMFTIPRLAIVCGLLIYPEGPLNPDMDATSMSEMYRPFQTLLFKIRELLYTLSPTELSQLEKSLCSSVEPEVTTPAVDSHTRSLLEMGEPPETLLQIDQGFDEDGSENLVPFDGVGSSILVHTANSGSPVTPINMNPDLAEFGSISPSSTIVDGSFHFSPTSNMNQSLNEGFSNLNKSESQDSGLHSENVSTSDTVTVDAPPLSSQEVGGTSSCKLPPSDEISEGEVISTCIEQQIDIKSDIIDDRVSESDSNVVDAFSSESSASNEDVCLKSCCRLETGSNVRHLCREIIDDVVTGAVKSCEDRPAAHTGTNDDAGSHSTRPRALHSQFSWQYNVQFAIPCISMSDQESEFSNDRSSGSFSSDSTLSDQGQQGNITDFVIDALTGIDGTRVTNSIATISNSESQTTSNPLNSELTPNHCDTCLPSTQTDHDTPPDLVEPTDAHNTSPSTDTPTDPNSLLQVGTDCNVAPAKHKREKRRGSLERIHCRTGPRGAGEEGGELQRIQRLQYTESISSSCRSTSSVGSECECDRECTCAGSDTSSYNSEMNDEEEIALAIQACELASRNEARSRFRSSSDLVHRLFVCIAGVADQLQSNYAADLRHILQCVFEINCRNPYVTEDEPQVDEGQDVTTLEGQQADGESASTQTEFPDETEGSVGDSASASPSASPRRTNRQLSSPRRRFDPPAWVPDEDAPGCISCKTPFTFVRRRHHCRNCGKVFCGRCSSNSVPLPQYGHQNAVRVCNRCFLFQVTHFTVDD